MDSIRSLKEDLREELIQLHRAHQIDREDKLPPNEVEQRLNFFDRTWQDRINDAEHGALGNIEPNLELMLREQQLQKDVRANAVVSNMRSRDGQVAYWDQRDNGPSGPTQEMIEKATEQTQQRYTDLREGMVDAVHEIAAGKEPDLSFLLERQLDKEQKLQNALDEITKLQERERENER